MLRYEVIASDNGENKDTDYFPARISVLAETERKAISKAKKIVKRERYRILNAEELASNPQSLHAIAVKSLAMAVNNLLEKTISKEAPNA